MTDKRTLRTQLRIARGSSSSRGIAAPAAFLRRLAPGMIIAAYVPIGSEADPASLVSAARQAGCLLCLPHVVDRDTPLRFLAWDDAAGLGAGPFGLMQPATHHDEVAPDVILTPLVGFDRTGNRIGQGAGHYDRAFAAHPTAWRIGVALSVQEVGTLVPDPWDVPLHAVVTEKEWIWTSTPTT